MMGAFVVCNTGIALDVYHAVIQYGKAFQQRKFFSHIGADVESGSDGLFHSSQQANVVMTVR